MTAPRPSRLMVVLFFVLSSLAFAQTPTLGPNDALAFDYLNADLTNYAVTRFEVAWDGGTFGTFATTAFTDAGTSPGATSYKFSPPFTNGNHSVAVRACNLGGCGAATPPFVFAYAVPLATAPFNLRKVAK